ncbi:MAG: glycine cleavage system protein H [Desulfobacterales bacterium]|nr:glycine cleavage system protein H [Desulfobacterales bacterium]
MAEKMNESKRSHIGFGSTYLRGGASEARGGIHSVLGGQVWTVKPDKDAAAKNPCVWMQAGIVDFKSCNNFYDCPTCKYDQGMLSQVARGKQISWQTAMRKKPDLQRLCRHSLTQRIASRVCAYDYQCGHCDFDQFFEDVLSPGIGTHACEVGHVRGFAVPYGHYFHMGHTWARIESGGAIRVGLDDFASKLLGKADAMELPLLGYSLEQSRPGFGLKRKGHAAEVISPLGGVVTAVNGKVRETPGLAGESPYENGWLFMLHTPNVKKAIDTLMDSSESMKWLGTEVDCLEKMIEEVAGPLAADGGLLTNDIFGALPELGWDRLTKKFLKSGK